MVSSKLMNSTTFEIMHRESQLSSEMIQQKETRSSCDERIMMNDNETHNIVFMEHVIILEKRWKSSFQGRRVFHFYF